VVGENDMNLMRDELISGFGMYKLKFTYSYNCCEPYSGYKVGFSPLPLDPIDTQISNGHSICPLDMHMSNGHLSCPLDPMDSHMSNGHFICPLDICVSIGHVCYYLIQLLKVLY
jgi:hypothetical protein